MRIINLGNGGQYHKSIKGDYVEGKKKAPSEKKPKPSQPNPVVEVIKTENGTVINTNSANYTENLEGEIIG